MRKVKPYLPGPKFKITSGIYLIRCPESGDTYVGKSMNLSQRWCQHRSDLKKGKHKNPQLQALYNQYGFTGLTMELLELVEDPLDLENREVYYIDTLSPSLNVTDTKLSRNDVVKLRTEAETGAPLEDLCTKYNLTMKYLKEILRGGRWKS